MPISQVLANTIISYCQNGISPKDSIDKVFNFAQKKGLSGFIPETFKALDKIISQNTEKAQIKVFTPYPLTESLKKDISKSLKDTKDVSQIQEYVDKKYIAGFRTEYNFIFNDKTVLYKLNKLEEFLKENTNVA
jgi:F0F1-type ATP synthase delta subunit